MELFFYYRKMTQITTEENSNNNSWLFDWTDREIDLWLIEDIDGLIQKEQSEFIGNRLITKNPENDWEDNFFTEEYYEN